MTKLFDLLKEGVAIKYYNEDSTIAIWTEHRTADKLIRLAELISECFNVEPSEIEIFPNTDKKMKIRFEFKYQFKEQEKPEPNIEQEESEEPVIEGDEEANVDDTWVKITDKCAYRVVNGELIIAWKRVDKFVNALRITMDDLKRLYDTLPDEADSATVRAIAAKIGLNVSGFETYIMRVLANRVEFGGEVIKEGKVIKLIKEKQELRNEVKRKLEQEKEVIGTPWNV